MWSFMLTSFGGEKRTLIVLNELCNMFIGKINNFKMILGRNFMGSNSFILLKKLFNNYVLLFLKKLIFFNLYIK